MRNSVKWSAIGASAAAILLSGVVAGFAQDKMAIVKDRQHFMDSQGADVKAISDYAKGQGDKTKAEAAVDDLIAKAPKIADQFPPGTSAADFPGNMDKPPKEQVTHAKPDIWTDNAKFKAIPVTLLSEEQKLKAAIATGDQKAVADQLGATGKAGCGACHTTYRLPLS